MTHYNYLIIGAGMTADAAVRGIRSLDSKGSLGLIGAEADAPYTRPMLSKGLWKGKPLEKVWRGTDQLDVKMHLATRITGLDPARKLVRDDKGGEHTYDKLLLATGGTPRRLPAGIGGEEVIYFRTLEDFRRLHALSQSAKRFVVIGGGFIGSEVAAALAMNGREVVLILMEDAICARIFPSELAHYVGEYFRGKGVEVVTKDSVAAIDRKGKKFAVRTEAGKTFEADGVVAGIGIRPNIELAQSAGIEVDKGILVDDRLRTNLPDIYAAGDVAVFPAFALDKRLRVEHEDNALKMGEIAGRNMAGADARYDHLPFFYSDLFELGYEAVGELNSKMEIQADWEQPYQKGVVYYLSAGRVRGVLLWNVWDKVPAARELIASPGPYKPEDLRGKIRG